MPAGFAAGMLDGLDDACDIAVPGACELAVQTGGQVGDMTHTWSDVEDRRVHAQDVVDLARVDQANEGITHNDDVKVCGGKGP
jgi:hypothetical protein